MIKKNRTLFLSLALCASISYAEDDGGFFTVGYQLGQVMQDVQNPGGTKRDELARELNAGVTNNILNNNTEAMSQGRWVTLSPNTFIRF